MDSEHTDRALRVYREWIPKGLAGDVFPAISFKKSPQFSDFDYFVYLDGDMNHLIEVKDRNNTIVQYAYTKIPIRKHATAEHFMTKYGIKTYFVCSFIDCVAILPLWEEPDKDEIMVARHDRGEDKDIYAMYSISRFKVIS